MPSMQNGFPDGTGGDGGGPLTVKTLTAGDMPYTLLESDFDGNTIIRCDSASAHDINLPADLAVTSPVFICQVQVGETTLVAASGVNVLSTDGLQIRDQYGGFALVPMSLNNYHVFGAMTDAA